MLTLKDNIISALDDYAEYVLKSGFSGAISQEEAVEFILESIKERVPEKAENLVGQDTYQWEQNTGYNRAIKEFVQAIDG